jgi:hypothetical protein
MTHKRQSIPYPKCLGPEVFQVSDYLFSEYLHRLHWLTIPSLKTQNLKCSKIYNCLSIMALLKIKSWILKNFRFSN